MADVTGAVSGVIRDSSGAAVPGASIVITELSTNVRHTLTSTADGRYNFLSLAPGHYRVTVSATGFQTSTIQDIDVKVNDQLQFDLALVVGGVQQSVEVEANSVQVQTSSTQMGGTIESKEMLALPLNGRSYLDLLSLQAGVAPRPSSSAATDRPLDSGLSSNSGNVSVNGQPETANAFLVNGGDVSETKNNGAGLIPNIDSVAEFRLITNSFDAEYGKFTGAIMNTITKSGSNKIHGDGFEFYRNDAMDAKGYLDPVKATLKRNQFGYAVGGPIWKDRLFWFTDYQGSRQTAGVPSTSIAVPTAAQRSGQFAPSVFGTAKVNGAAFAATLASRLGRSVSSGELYSSVFPDGNLAGAIDPIAAKEISFIPAANVGSSYSPAGLNNTVRDDKAGQRIDFHNQKTGDWAFYYVFDDSNSYNQSSASNYLPGFAVTTPTRAQMFMVSNTKIIGSTMVNEARATFFRTAIQTAQPDFSQPGNKTTLASLGYNTSPTGLGIVPSGPVGYGESVPPEIFNSFAFGNPLTNMKSVDNNYMASDTFSKLMGAHSLKFGGETRYYQLNVRNVCAPNGQFNYTGGETGSDFADFLLGAPSQYTQCSEQLLDNRARYSGAFFEDTWKARHNLTLNLGVRYEIPVPWYDKYDRLDTFIQGVQSTQFPQAPLGNLFPGDPGVRRTISPTFYNRFGPRLGLAYAPEFDNGLMRAIFGSAGKSSIRAAYGIYYLGAADSANFGVIGSAPYGLYWNSSAQPTLDEPFRTRSNGESQTQRFPFTLPVAGDPNNSKLSFKVFEPIVGPGLNTNNKLAYAEHYNMSFQRQISSSTVLTVAYVGTQSHNLQGDLNLNVGDPNLCLSLAASGATPTCGPNNEKQVFTRPDGSKVYGTLIGMQNQQLGGVIFGHVHLYSNIGASNYNSLQVTLERKARNFSFLGAYTYGKSIDNVSTTFLPSDFRRNRAVSPFDLRHNFVVSYNYQIPFERAFGNLPKRLTEGWNVSGITRFATGFPITVSQSGDLALTGFSFDFPNYSGTPVSKSNPRAPSHQYFNKSAFTTEVVGVIGNSNPRPVFGPGILNTDAGVSKLTKIRDGYSFEVRAEFFNIFNHAQFTSVQGNFASSQFGQVTAAAPARIGQISAKFLF
ncbi:carboxypeptidase regulatory-like domain-containing protein [Granulicella sp. WH15]|uniref:carboxypeptidase regulatory-like domain-containing protein n=1 Tax=Granulicella sp. WH15 TaxID=2602070 RepID=UPI0013A55379|nr:carboxypeptidase regulatory-like domain-containing protein [Granulicella sp. WH15]